MYVEALVTLQNSRAETLPTESIVYFKNKSYVFEILKGNRFRLLPAETGASHEGFTEILNTRSLQGKQIVREGAYDLLMGLKNR